MSRASPPSELADEAVEGPPNPERRRARTPIPKSIQVRVYARDGWLCRWCGRPVVFPPALKYLEQLMRDKGCMQPLSYYDKQWRRDRAPLLDHLGAVIDHVQAFAHGGAHDESNFVTSCNKCNTRKNADTESNFGARAPKHVVKGKYGEPRYWDGFSAVFITLATPSRSTLSKTERDWLDALVTSRPEP